MWPDCSDGRLGLGLGLGLEIGLGLGLECSDGRFRVRAGLGIGLGIGLGLGLGLECSDGRSISLLAIARMTEDTACGVGLGLGLGVRVSVSAWSSLRAGVAPLANDEWHEVRQLDVGL
jgi:hypothetical protein